MCEANEPKAEVPALVVPRFPNIGFAAGCCCWPNALVEPKAVLGGLKVRKEQGCNLK